MSQKFGPEGAPPTDPLTAARRDLRQARPKRFFTEASVAPRDGGFALLLDGRPARTPARHALLLPTRAAGQAVADEWMAQGETLDPAAMPITRIVNSALD